MGDLEVVRIEVQMILVFKVFGKAANDLMRISPLVQHEMSWVQRCSQLTCLQICDHDLDDVLFGDDDI